jgi:hypothetical protein
MTYQYPAPDPFIKNVWKIILDKMLQNDYIKSNICDISIIRSPLKEKTFADAVDIFTNYLNTEGAGEIHIGYHGTSATYLDSIIDKGLLSPMDAKYKLVNGNAYGKGVYISTDAAYSVGYARSVGNNTGTFLVCAYIKGIYCDLTMFKNGRQPTKNPQNMALTNNRESMVLYPINTTNELTECNCVMSSNIHVLQGSCQVLPIFSLKLKTITNMPLIDLTRLNLDKIAIANSPKPDHVELATNLQSAYPLVDIGKIIHLISRGHIQYIEQQNPTNAYAMMDNIPTNIEWCTNYVVDQLDNYDW